MSGSVPQGASASAAKQSAAPRRLRSRPQRRTDLAAASVACAVSALTAACRKHEWHPTQQAARCRWRCRCGLNAPHLLRTLHALTHRVQLSSQSSHLGHHLGCRRSRRLGLSRDRWALACLPPQQLKIGPQLASSVLGRLPHVSGWAVHRCAAARMCRASAGRAKAAPLSRFSQGVGGLVGTGRGRAAGGMNLPASQQPAAIALRASRSAEARARPASAAAAGGRPPPPSPPPLALPV